MVLRYAVGAVLLRETGWNRFRDGVVEDECPHQSEYQFDVLLIKDSIVYNLCVLSE